MTIEKFLKERIKSYLETRKGNIEETKSDLKNAKNIFNNGDIEWQEKQDDMIHYNNLNNLQEDFDSDWTEWVTMCPEFSEFTEEEQEEIKDSDEFQQTPVNVWNLI